MAVECDDVEEAPSSREVDSTFHSVANPSVAAKKAAKKARQKAAKDEARAEEEAVAAEARAASAAAREELVRRAEEREARERAEIRAKEEEKRAQVRAQREATKQAEERAAATLASLPPCQPPPPKPRCAYHHNMQLYDPGSKHTLAPVFAADQAACCVKCIESTACFGAELYGTACYLKTAKLPLVTQIPPKNVMLVACVKNESLSRVEQPPLRPSAP